MDYCDVNSASYNQQACDLYNAGVDVDPGDTSELMLCYNEFISGVTDGSVPSCQDMIDMYTCVGLPDLSACCDHFDAYMETLEEIVTECPSAIVGAFECSNLDDLCDSKCTDLIFNKKLYEFSYCIAEGFLQDVDIDLGGMDSYLSDAMTSVSDTYTSVCRHAAEITEEQCQDIQDGTFDFSELVEKYYPEFEIPETVDLSLVIDGIVENLDADALAAAVESATDDLKAAFAEANIPWEYVGEISVEQDGAKLIIEFSYMPPEDFDESLKDLFPEDFDASFTNEFINVDGLPDGSNWVGSNGQTWGSYASALEAMISSDVQFDNLSQSDAVADGEQATYSSTESSAVEKETTYEDLGRDEPAYGTGLDGAASRFVATGSILAAAAVALLRA